MADQKSELSIKGLTAWVETLSASLKVGVDAAMLEGIELAYKQAVLNARNDFNNTKGRVRSGQLMNSIYRHYDPSTKVGYVGAKLAYARIQELGGTVKPVNAKHLWVKNHVGVGQFNRMTPREFMASRENDKENHFVLFRNPKTKHLIAGYNSGKRGKAQMLALFTLVDEVTLPARPYIQPAVDKAAAALSSLLKKHIGTTIE